MADVLLVLLVAAPVLLLRPRARRLGTRTRSPGPTAADGSDGSEAATDPVAVVELLAVAVESGASVPGALEVVGRVLGGRTGAHLARAGSALLLGAAWETAWAHAPALAAGLDGLAAAWRTGAAPGPPLRTAAAELRRRRDRAAREAAGRLGVRLVLPLGLCFLPAFVLIGLVPVLVSLGRSLLG
jgi:hypothetical protein